MVEPSVVSIHAKPGADSAGGGGGIGARAPPPRQWLQAWVYTYYFIMR